MFKKVFLFSFVAGLVSLAACQKNGGDSPRSYTPGSPVEVTVTIRGSHGNTKVTGTSEAAEKNVRSLQVFVFNGEELENHRSVSESMTALIPATAGERTVWAVVNAPDIYSVLNVSDSDPITLTKLKNHMSTLEDNVFVGEGDVYAADNFVMVGSKTQELVDGGNVDISVKRIVARVSIEKISASLKDYREDYSVRLNSIYLINVPLNASLDLQANPTVWGNKLGLEENPKANFLLCDDLAGDEPVIIRNNVYKRDGSIIHEHEAYVEHSLEQGIYEIAEGVTLDKDNSYRMSHVFYPYPNAIGSDGANYNSPNWDVWSPRGTMLVIDATMISDRDDDGDGELDETSGYYPIVLPAIERNKTYSIQEVKITRLPGDSPYKPIETGESKVVINVEDWELGLDMGTIAI